MSDRVDYLEFYAHLQKLLADNGQGTLFVRTDKNHLVIVALQEGRIVSLACGPKRGELAIPLIREMHTGDLRLDPSAIPYHAQELPSTAHIMELLKPGVGQTVQHQAAAAPKAPATTPLNGADRGQRLCALLTDYIGPVAPLVCEEKVAILGGLDNPKNAQGIVTALAGEIQDAEEARQFISRALQMLQTAQTPPPASPPVQSSPAVGAGTVNMDKARQILCDLLTDYLGPVAPLICEEKVIGRQSSASLSELETTLEEIAMEIDEPGEAEEFLTRAWQSLQVQAG